VKTARQHNQSQSNPVGEYSFTPNLKPKMKVIESPITDNMWQELDPEYKRFQPIPEGFESYAQIALKLNRGVTSAKQFIYRLLSDGKVDMMVHGPSGAKYYRPKNYAKQNQKNKR